MIVKVAIMNFKALTFLYFLSVVRGAEISSRSNNTSPVYDTIVVGLGTSGLAALGKLARHGKKVLGLEGMDRIGGRVMTISVGNGILELGAEWIHGRNNSRTYELAVAHNVSVENQPDTYKVYRSDGSAVDQDLFMDLLYNCMSAESIDEPISLGQQFRRMCNDYITKNKPELLQDPKFIEDFYEFLDVFTTSNDPAANWNEVSAKSLYENLDEYLVTSLHKHGYKTIFDIILNKHNNGSGLPNADIKLKKEVSQISWPQDPQSDVVVHCTDGSEYRANNVIVTVSLGVLKARQASFFSSPLPETKLDAIEKISIGTLDKVILVYDEVWWPKNTTYFAFLWKAEDRTKVPKESFWSSKIGGASQTMGMENALVLWIAGEEAKSMETLPDEVVKTQATNLLRIFMGSSVPEARDVIKTNWFSNEFTRGSYTYDNLLAPQHPHLRDQLGTPLLDSAGKPRVLFAGEATNHNHFGTVHGAFETGIREANRLLGDSKLSIE